MVLGPLLPWAEPRGPDQRIEPADGAVGHATALLAFGVPARRMMARRVAMNDEDGVVLGRRQRAIGFVGKFEHGQRMAIFQPEFAGSEELAFDIRQVRHLNSQGPVAI
jgi:hypothetical protein